MHLKILLSIVLSISKCNSWEKYKASQDSDKWDITFSSRKQEFFKYRVPLCHFHSYKYSALTWCKKSSDDEHTCRLEEETRRQIQTNPGAIDKDDYYAWFLNRKIYLKQFLNHSRDW